MVISVIDSQVSSRKRKRQTSSARNSEKIGRQDNDKKATAKRGEALNADQLVWKKISLQNDEFDDLEEIEGVDVEYTDGVGHFKVHNL